MIVDDLPVAIIAALVNPIGGEGQGNNNVRPENVYLLNRTTQDISLDGWSLLNKNDAVQRISDSTLLASGDVRKIDLTEISLSNRGGLITLLDENGNKVDGVSYTKKRANKEGELVIFR